MNERDKLIERAIGERRISAAQRDEYRRLYDAQPAVIENLLTAGVREGGLMPGLAAAHETLDPSALPYDPAWLNDRERAVLATHQVQAASPPAVPVTPPGSPRKKRKPSAATATAHKHPPRPPVAVPETDDSDAYDDTWLTASERSRRDAVKAGTFQHGPIQFEDDAARAAAGTAGAR